MYNSECYIIVTDNPKSMVNIRLWNGLTGNWDYAGKQFKPGTKVRIDPNSSKQISPGIHLLESGVQVKNFYDVVGATNEGLQGGYVAEELLKPIECDKKLIADTDEAKRDEYGDAAHGQTNGSQNGSGVFPLLALLGLSLLALDK